MMEKEFDLSSKLEDLFDIYYQGHISKQELKFGVEKLNKEFIRQLKETEIDLRDIGLTYEKGEEVWKIFNELINKLAGEDLI